MFSFSQGQSKGLEEEASEAEAWEARLEADSAPRAQASAARR